MTYDYNAVGHLTKVTQTHGSYVAYNYGDAH
jgi:YD repeat-containing protein